MTDYGFEGDAPAFHEKITVPEATDTNHATNINSAPKQLLENTLALRSDVSHVYDATSPDYPGVSLEERFAAEIEAADGSNPEQKRWNWMKSRIDRRDFSGIRDNDWLAAHVTAKLDSGGANSGTEQEEEHKMHITGISPYRNTAGAETHGTNTTTGLAPIPDHIDFVSEDCLSTPVKWNLTSTNAGTGASTADDATDAPYLTSNVHKYLEEVLKTMDEGLQAIITPKAMLLERRGTAAEALKDSTGWHWYDMGKLWLPTEYEVFGSVVWGTRGYSSGQALQYPIFANSWRNRIKGAGPHGGRCPWWLASGAGSSATHACIVNAAGNASYDDAANAGIRVPVCFRIAAAP